MKLSYLAIGAMLLLDVCLIRCNFRRGQPHPYFISGVYTTFEHANFSRTWDTLLITLDRLDVHRYRVIRHFWEQRNLGTYYYPAQYLHSQWNALYDSQSGALLPLSPGHTIDFIPSKNTLILAGIPYQRIE